MAANRKLQQLVDATLKKIEEGLTEFSEQWAKVEESTNPNQRVCIRLSPVGNNIHRRNIWQT
jgi:hypothetical protein